MPDRYFKSFPIISYNGSPCINITERTAVLNSIFTNPFIYYSYDISPGERPDNISDRYYDDQYKSWILYLSNKMTDPYYDWYMSDFTFNQMIIKIYGSYVNATSKIIYYTNNWYSQQDDISIQQYQSLLPSLKRFYEPHFLTDSNVTYNSYRRRQLDWRISTNNIVYISTIAANNSGFTMGEIADIIQNSVSVGSGEIVSVGNNIVIIKNTSGVISTINVSSVAGYLTGRKSNHVSQLSNNPNIVTTNIPVAETGYWDAVSYYDYEIGKNEANKSIRVLDASFAPQIVDQLTSLLN